MVLNPVIVQCGQVFITLALAPLLHGFIATAEERIQRGRGPSIFQPYRDLWLKDTRPVPTVKPTPG